MASKKYILKTLAGAATLAALSGCVAPYGTNTIEATVISKRAQAINETFLRYCEPLALGTTDFDVKERLLRDGYTQVPIDMDPFPFNFRLPSNARITHSAIFTYKKQNAGGGDSLIILGGMTVLQNEVIFRRQSCMASAGDSKSDLTQETGAQYRGYLEALIRQDSQRFEQKIGWPETVNISGMQAYAKTDKSTTLETHVVYAVPLTQELMLLAMREGAAARK